MNISWPEKFKCVCFYKPCYCGADRANVMLDACKKAVEEAQKEYKANFCFGNNDPFDDLMYEFANAHTEEYREEVFKNIKSMFEQEHALVPIEWKYCENCLGTGYLGNITVAVKCLKCNGHGKLEFKSKPRPVVTVEELAAEMCQNVHGVKILDTNQSTRAVCYQYAQAIFEYLKEKE